MILISAINRRSSIILFTGFLIRQAGGANQRSVWIPKIKASRFTNYLVFKSSLRSSSTKTVIIVFIASVFIVVFIQKSVTP